MFENQLGLRENPFVAGHQPRFVYPSREHQEALAHLRFGIENREPFVLITGEVGTGKTTAIYDALQGWGAKAVVALITNSALTRPELLEEIALRFGLALPPGLSKPQAMVLLERHLHGIRERGELAVLLLDEAQNLERDLLEEIRLLSNLEGGGQKLMQIFLVGQPELEQKLARVELRQLRQRITVHYRLNPLSPEETENYIHHRVAVAGGNARELFPHDTCLAVYSLTHGIPREINTVCGQALINAFVDDSTVVKPAHVMSLARDTTFRSVLDEPFVAGDVASAEAVLTAEAGTVGPRPIVPAPPLPPAAAAELEAYAPMPEPESAPVAETAPAAPAPEPVPVAETAPPMFVPPVSESESAVAEEPALPEEPIAPSALETPPAPWHEPEPAIEPPAPAMPAMATTPAESAPAAESAASEEPQTVLPPAVAMPAWLDEVIARKQAARGETPPVAAPKPEVVSARLPAPAMPAPPPPTPLRTATEAMKPAAVPEPTGLRPEFLSSRLRDKLETTAPQKRASSALPWFVAAVVFAIVAVAMILMVRFGDQLPWNRKTATHAATASAPATETPATPAPADSTAAAAPESTAAEPAAQTPATQTQPLPAATSPVAAAPSPTEPTPHYIYGIVVGTYFDKERAAGVAQKAAGPLGMPTRTIAVIEDGAPMYRAVVGRFEDRALADLAATRLAEQGGVSEARVIVLGSAAPKK